MLAWNDPRNLTVNNEKKSQSILSAKGKLLAHVQRWADFTYSYFQGSRLCLASFSDRLSVR